MAAMRAALRRATPALAATAALVKLQTLDRKDFAPSRCSDSLEFAARELLRETVQFAELNGLLYGLKDPGADASAATQCPVAMLPFKIPSRAFQECVALSPLWNKLVDAVARDVAWLHATLEPAASADPFTGRLLQMSKEIHREGLKQPIMLGIHRSDYMLHEGSENSEPRFLQVELNTIASSMGAHALNVGKLHRFLLSRFGGDGDRVAQALQSHFGLAPSSGWSQRDVQRHLPENVTLQAIPAALAKAHQAYGVKDAKVVFVVNEDLRNFADWCQLEYALWQTHGVRVVQRTLAQLKQQATMEQDGTLRLDGSEVSVVYYRAGYGPEDYPTEVQWDARGMLERSKAIKCPSVDYQLVGAKKVQQALARPGAVERFLSSRDSSKLRSCFAGLWGLGPQEDDEEIIRTAMASPEHYVLKPQREGGGHNFYGSDVATKLKELSREDRGAYILMQRIMPGLQPSVMTRQGQLKVMNCLSEFGFYSVYVGDGRRVYFSRHAGHLVRTKAQGVDEGGVAAGYAVISSPYLTG